MDLSLHQISEQPELSNVEEEDMNIGEEEIRHLESELSELQNQFDSSMIEKHSLTNRCQQLTLKLKLAKNLLERLVCSVYSSVNRGMEIVSQLFDILTYFHNSCPAPHILCVQLSFSLPDIH